MASWDFKRFFFLMRLVIIVLKVIFLKNTLHNKWNVSILKSCKIKWKTIFLITNFWCYKVIHLLKIHSKCEIACCLYCCCCFVSRSYYVGQADLEFLILLLLHLKCWVIGGYYHAQLDQWQNMILLLWVPVLIIIMPHL